MDELVAVGVAGIIGLFVTGLVLLSIIAWVAARIWSTFVTGDWWTDAEILLALLVLATGYAVTGIWLQRTGRI